MHSDLKAMGRLSVEALLRGIGGKPASSTLPPPVLVPRASTVAHQL